MKKVQALPVFLSLLLICSVVLAPIKTSAISLRDYYNPFAKINEYIMNEKKHTARFVNQEIFTQGELQDDSFTWRELPMHTEYTVKKGDTIKGIAQLYKIAEADVQEANPWVKEPLDLGQILYIPLMADRVHHVNWGETIYSIAYKYGVTASELLAINEIYSTEPLQISQELRIPKERKYQRVSASSTQQAFHNSMTWPVNGLITSYFGPRWGRFHQGIDIWEQREFQTPIYAALPGTVIYADWSGSGYGRLVVIDHGNGIKTYYAHLNKINVIEKQLVKQGDLIGKMGDTGETIGVHLHFELRINDQPVNPLLYLPKP